MKLTVYLAVLAMLAGVACAGAEPAKSVVARDFGVKGDGVADDAPALQQAINSVGATGGVVNLGAGTYVLRSTVTVHTNVRLVGEGACWENSATMVLVRHKDGPAFRLGSYCGLKGLSIYYPDNTNLQKPDAYPPAVELVGCAVSIEDIVFDCAWIGISTAPGGANAGQCLFRDITGFTHHIGIHLSGGMDINRFEDIHWFVPKNDPSASGPSYYKENRVGFEFGRQDGVMMTNCFMILGKTFFRQLPYQDTPEGKFLWGLSLGYAISNCWIEAVQEGFVFEGHSGFSITGTNILVNKGGVGIKIKADCVAYNGVVSGVQVRGYGEPFTGIDYDLKHDIYPPDKRNKLNITDCHIADAKPAIHLGKESVRATIKGCTLAGVKGSPAIQIDKGADLFIITDNFLQGENPIKDDSDPKAQKVIKDNLFEK